MTGFGGFLRLWVPALKSGFQEPGFWLSLDDIKKRKTEPTVWLKGYWTRKFSVATQFASWMMNSIVSNVEGDASGTNPCLCGAYSACYYIIESIRPINWHPKMDIQRKVDDCKASPSSAYITYARDPNVYSQIPFLSPATIYLSIFLSICLLGPNTTFPYPFLLIRLASLR
jgi:hypothetical protein